MCDTSQQKQPRMNFWWTDHLDKYIIVHFVFKVAEHSFQVPMPNSPLLSIETI